MKPSGIGGMAVMEGVMMKNKGTYAVAVRKPNNEIVVEKNTHNDFSDKFKLFKLPIFRGILAFLDSLVLGIKVLNFSASFFEEEESDLDKKKEKAKKKRKKGQYDTSEFEIEELSATRIEVEKLNAEEAAKKADRANALMMIATVMFSVVLSIGLFMVLPVLLSNIFSFTENRTLINLLEGLIRFGIFIGYVYLASRLNEIKRVFMYHGAEHKTINCIEHGYELTVDNVRKQSKEHKRCGTSFTLLVILISLVFFMFLPTDDLLWKIVSRVVFVPFIAGVSYEFIRLAGRSENKIVEIISKPGLWMQALTTKEPDDSMIEVAIKSVDAVFDWEPFVKDIKESEPELVATQEIEILKSEEMEEAAKIEPEEEAVNLVKETSAKGKKEKPEGTLDTKSKSKNEKPVKSTSLNRSMPTSATTKSSNEEEEDDEILKALDKFFDENNQ